MPQPIAINGLTANPKTTSQTFISDLKNKIKQLQQASDSIYAKIDVAISCAMLAYSLEAEKGTKEFPGFKGEDLSYNKERLALDEAVETLRTMGFLGAEDKDFCVDHKKEDWASINRVTLEAAIASGESTPFDQSDIAQYCIGQFIAYVKQPNSENAISAKDLSELPISLMTDFLHAHDAHNKFLTEARELAERKELPAISSERFKRATATLLTFQAGTLLGREGELVNVQFQRFGPGSLTSLRRGIATGYQQNCGHSDEGLPKDAVNVQLEAMGVGPVVVSSRYSILQHLAALRIHNLGHEKEVTEALGGTTLPDFEKDLLAHYKNFSMTLEALALELREAAEFCLSSHSMSEENKQELVDAAMERPLPVVARNWLSFLN
jgi:hypothetical protein